MTLPTSTVATPKVLDAHPFGDAWTDLAEGNAASSAGSGRPRGRDEAVKRGVGRIEVVTVDRKATPRDGLPTSFPEALADAPATSASGAGATNRAVEHLIEHKRAAAQAHHSTVSAG